MPTFRKSVRISLVLLYMIVFLCFQAKNWPKRIGVFEEAK